MIYTVAEVSENLKVSKVTIYNKLKELKQDLKPYVKTKNNVKYIDNTGIEIIRKSINSKDTLNDAEETLKENTTQEGKTPPISEDLSKLINLLQNELQVKNGQIDTLSRQLENMQILLKDKEENLKRLLPPSEAEGTNKTNFFSRLFLKIGKK